MIWIDLSFRRIVESDDRGSDAACITEDLELLHDAPWAPPAEIAAAVATGRAAWYVHPIVVGGRVLRFQRRETP